MADEVVLLDSSEQEGPEVESRGPSKYALAIVCLLVIAAVAGSLLTRSPDSDSTTRDHSGSVEQLLAKTGDPVPEGLRLDARPSTLELRALPVPHHIERLQASIVDRGRMYLAVGPLIFMTDDMEQFDHIDLGHPIQDLSVVGGTMAALVMIPSEPAHPTCLRGHHTPTLRVSSDGGTSWETTSLPISQPDTDARTHRHLSGSVATDGTHVVAAVQDFGTTIDVDCLLASAGIDVPEDASIGIERDRVTVRVRTELVASPSFGELALTSEERDLLLGELSQPPSERAWILSAGVLEPSSVHAFRTFAVGGRVFATTGGAGEYLYDPSVSDWEWMPGWMIPGAGSTTALRWIEDSAHFTTDGVGWTALPFEAEADDVHDLVLLDERVIALRHRFDAQVGPQLVEITRGGRQFEVPLHTAVDGLEWASFLGVLGDELVILASVDDTPIFVLARPRSEGDRDG